MFPLARMTILGQPLFMWIYLAGLLSHLVLAGRRYVAAGLTWLHCLLIYLYLLGLCLAGGKVYELTDNFSYYRYNPSALLSMRGHGWNGVFPFVTLGLMLLFVLWKKPVLRFLDIYALYLPIAISVGRIGCLITADGDYGTQTSLPWGMTFQFGYFPTEVPVHPTPIYEIIVMLALFALLRTWIFGRSNHGWVLVVYLVGYAIERFLMEFIRLHREFALGLTLPQWMCITYLVAAVALGLWLCRRKSESP